MEPRDESLRRRAAAGAAGFPAVAAEPQGVRRLGVMSSPTDDSLRYAGFLPRLGALVLDFVIFLPLAALLFWASAHDRLFEVYSLVPNTLLGLFYYVYLVRRYGGTPGKLLVGIRIRKLNGEPVGYREALFRYGPDFILGLLLSVALVLPLFRISDTEYESLTFMARAARIVELAPAWYKPLHVVQQIWLWSELIVLLTNRKRRALHDFIAGTVVVQASTARTLSKVAANSA